MHALVFSIPSQEIGLGKRLQNDLFFVEWDVKPQLSQLISQTALMADYISAESQSLFTAHEITELEYLKCVFPVTEPFLLELTVVYEPEFVHCKHSY